MNEYHKINGIFKRDDKGNFIVDDWSTPEFEYLKDSVWDWDEKIDGTNIRIGLDNFGNFFIKGRTDTAVIPPLLMAALLDLDLERKLRAIYGHTVTLYGEGYGFKIQKVGKLYRPDSHSFCLFDVKVGKFWLLKDVVVYTAETLGIEVAPKLASGTLHEGIEFIKSNPKSTFGDFVMEGIIARPQVQLFNRLGSRIITKIKVKDFNK
jgi:hypothetical protein